MTEVYQMIEDCPKPSVAAIIGFAFGGGLELALACDLRVAESGARLGVPEIRLGMLPGAGGTQRLPRLLPAGIAKQLILTGEPITAERAFELGLVNELAPPGETLISAIALASAWPSVAARARNGQAPGRCRCRGGPADRYRLRTRVRRASVRHGRCGGRPRGLPRPPPAELHWSVAPAATSCFAGGESRKARPGKAAAAGGLWLW